MKKLGILHISDIHVSASAIPQIDGVVEKLINDINKVKTENGINIDLICFAGDLVGRGDNAIEGEMQVQLAEEHFITPLLKATGLTEKEFILVPGNHEVDKRVIAKRTEAGLVAIASKEELDETIFDMNDEYNGRLKWFYSYMYDKYLPDANGWNLGYSLNRKINDINVGIVGVDSAWRSSGAGEVEHGKMMVGEQQVGVLYEGIKNADLKICLMHHPLDWISGYEIRNVERKLNYFDLVLNGHVHDLADKQICTQRYKTIYNTSGKLYPIDGYYSGYSIIDVNMELATCCIFSREYLQAPREDFDKSLRMNIDGKVNYQLTAYDESKVIEYDLKMKLREYYEDATEKYTMLKQANSYSPEKIRDIFVEPIIYEESEYERMKAANELEQEEIRKPEAISLTELIHSRDNILMLGKKECGKTTILQQFGIAYTSSESEKIPVYIDMMKLPKGKDRILVACRNFIFNNMPSEVSISKEQINNVLSSGRGVCLFDNVNISNNDHLVWIQTFIKEFANNRFVIAAEEKFYQTYTLKELPDFGIAYKTAHIECFGKRQVREMVTKWGCGKEGFDANEMTQKIVAYCNNVRFAMTPFNIAVFMTIWDTDRNFVPINEGKVMRTYLETVLDKFSTEEFQRSAYDCNLKQNFLGYLAYKMCLKDEYFFTYDEFDEQVKEYHEKKGYTKSKTHFETLFFEKNILCINGNCIFFSNTSIMEYCLAYYATTEPALYSLMTQKGKRTRFAHELSFYSGIVQDCTGLLNDLNDEITSTVIENMDILDEVEKLSISAEFSISKKAFAEVLASNRCTIEEVDELDERTFASKDISPMEITKINSIEESESFFELLLIYGNVIKNAETTDKSLKKLHLENYVLGMNFQFGLLLKEFSTLLTSKSKEDLPDTIKEHYPDITDEEFDRMKDRVLDLLKTILPVAIQSYMTDNVGTPKLEVVISELIRENVNKKFTRFMLSFLLCDSGNEDMKKFLAEYIKEEDSKDILKLIMVKLGVYYGTWYFGKNPQMDSILLELITEVQLKLNGESRLQLQSQKGTVMKLIKQQCDAKRGKQI